MEDLNNSPQIDIGFMEKSDTWKLESRFFPSKVGGTPAWLNLEDLPSPAQLQCNLCHKPMIFLCQIYAPFEEIPNCFHRTIFIFVCTNPECCVLSTNKNFKVFRCQLPRKNKYFPEEPPKEYESWQPDLNAKKYVKLCNICGCSAPHQCSRCKTTYYCSKNHQVIDWKSEHKQNCQLEKTPKLNHNLLFPEYELVIEKEILNDLEKDDKDNNKIEENILEENKTSGIFQNMDDINDLEAMSKHKSDKYFKNFRKRIEKMDEQVIRYDRGGIPLYISSKNIPENKQIPNCLYCNGSMEFEFQILPQMLNYFKLDSLEKSLDWGILLIYTCKESCSNSNNGYMEEFLWKQDIFHDDDDDDDNK